jgi:uncharacterized membrane protein YkoI
MKATEEKAMSVTDGTRRTARARTTLVAAIALLLGGPASAVLLAQSQGPQVTSAQQTKSGQRAKSGQQANSGQQDPAYRSSIRVQDDAKSETEGGEKAEGKEGAKADSAEAARFRRLARITPAQARAAATARVAGKVTGVELENENGNLVYGVTIQTAKGEADVKVDAGNGKVLHVDRDKEK